MRCAEACSWGTVLGYLVITALLQGSRGDDECRGESCGPEIYDDDYGDVDEVPPNLAELNRTIIACCNKTRLDVLSSVQDLSSTITTKIKDLASKEDLTNLQDELDKLATISAVTGLQGKLDELPSTDTIRNYTDHINDKFTTLVKNLDNSAKNLISNGTHKLSLGLDGIKTKTEQILNKLKNLSTSEDIQNLTEIFGNLATKSGLNSTNNKLSLNIQNVQENVNELKVLLAKLVNKNDVEKITNLVESLATKESFKTFENKLNSLSKEDTIKNLTDFVSNQIADKTDIGKTKEKITASTTEIKKELSALGDKLTDLAANTDLQSLNTKVVGIDEKISTSKETVSELKEMLQNLQKKQEEQNKILQKLTANVGKPSSSQELENVENLMKALQTTSTSTLLAVKNISNNGQNETNCMDASEFSTKIFSLRKKVDKKCSVNGVQNDLQAMEERIHKRLDNITLCDKMEFSPKTTIPIARSCEDTVFINPPQGLNVCKSVVTKRLCDTDPLMGFHCCNSCVFAGQISSSNGPHLYVNAPRKIYYNDVLRIILSEKNY